MASSNFKWSRLFLGAMRFYKRRGRARHTARREGKGMSQSDRFAKTALRRYKSCLRERQEERCGTQRGAEKEEKGVKRIDLTEDRPTVRGATEEVTWDSIVVPRLPKYYSTAVR